MADAALLTQKQTDTTTAYARLEAHFGMLNALSGVGSILHWDAAVIMPETAAEVRGEQLAALRQVMHEKTVAPQIEDWINAAEAEQSSLESWQQANLREMRRAYTHATALDSALVRELALASSQSEAAWRSARRDNDFVGFLPYFKRVVAAARNEAQAKADALSLAPYDALMDGYDPDTRMEEVDVLFARLNDFLPDFREKVMTHQQKNLDAKLITGSYPTEKQRQLSETFMHALGFKGRLDVSTHPFCGGVPGDVRITTRYNEKDFVDALQGVLHETGHALYEQNLPDIWRNQPVGHARGMSAHESQSLLVEMQLCRSREFLRYAAPYINEALGEGSPDDLSAENLYRVGVRVKPDYIRVRADEVTYPSHVIMRYELEKDIINGALDVADLPEAWNAKMQEKLGITPPSDTLGCMQDIHWPSGSFGYFPTYTIGAMMAAQWFAALKRDIPEWGAQVEKGDFAQISHWLKRNIHEKASSVSRQQMLVEGTGEALNVDIYLQHLHDRYMS
ncbi:MAG: carboxypeptidase M32 [Alphaproteobacteria bacterium]|nr:carboxypeptidase M32 [Alphaproteobacteria bacterium]